MQLPRFARHSGLVLLAALGCATVSAHAAGDDEHKNKVSLGYAHVGFNVKSGDVTGPAGTTPPGVQADLKDTRTLALVYERRLSGPWSVVLQAGAPPEVEMIGAGAGAALGAVGTTRAWFPAVLGQYTFKGPWGTEPYVGAGANYTFYSGEQVKPVYTTAFSGTASTAALDSSWGHVVKVGVGIPLGERALIDVTYAHYGISTTASITTATPGFGDIARTVDVKANPGVIGLLVGFRF
ncbi:MAG: OmpW family protein [Acidobacteria bacterium]|nr:OmpW family protein [Acidobacteriota bacterium]